MTKHPPLEKKMAARRRQTLVLQKRAAGIPMTEIAEELGISVPTAYRLFNTAIDAQQAEGVARYRAVDGERTEALIRAAWPAAMEGEGKAQLAVIRALDHRAKLFGLYAPTRVQAEVTAAPEPIYGDPELQAWARQACANLGEPLWPEADARAVRALMGPKMIEGETA